jgi:hypothetical protein
LLLVAEDDQPDRLHRATALRHRKACVTSDELESALSLQRAGFGTGGRNH